MTVRTRRLALSIALAKPAPSHWSLSDPDKIRQRDFSAVYLLSSEHRYVLQYLTRLGARARRYNREGPDEAGVELSLLNTALTDFELEIDQYRSWAGLKYTSDREFILHNLMGWIRFKAMMEGLKLRLYGAMPLVEADRIKVLRFFIDRTLEKRNYEGTFIDLMTGLYGPRWGMHPEVQRRATYYTLMLESLALDGNLKAASDGRYKLNAAAMTTVSVSEVDERRHRDNRGRQTVLGWLTAVLAIIGIVQAAAQVAELMRPATSTTALAARSAPLSPGP